MQTKTIVATQKESSITIRMKPVKIGELLAKVHPSELPVVAEAFMQAGGMCHEDVMEVAASFFDACQKYSQKAAHGATSDQSARLELMQKAQQEAR